MNFDFAYKMLYSFCSFDARVGREWFSDKINDIKDGQRLKADINSQPTSLIITDLMENDQALYHCRVDFALAQTRYFGVNVTVVGKSFAIFEYTIDD